MMHYVPVDGVYVCFRYDDDQNIMCMMNTDSKAHELDFKKYTERTSTFSEAVNIISNNKLKTSEKATIPAMQMWVLELKK